MEEIKTYCQKEVKEYRKQVIQNRIDRGFPKSMARERIELSLQKSLPDGKGDFWIVAFDNSKAISIKRYYDPAF